MADILKAHPALVTGIYVFASFTAFVEAVRNDIIFLETIVVDYVE